MSYGEVLFSLIPLRLQEADQSAKAMRILCDCLGAQAASDKALLDLLSLETCPLTASSDGVDRWLTSQGVFDLALLPESHRRAFAIHLPKLRAKTGTIRALEECLRLLGYTSPEVTPLFTTLALPVMADVSNPSNLPYISAGMSSPALGGAFPYPVESDDFAPLFARRALGVRTAYLSFTAAGAQYALTLPTGVGASITTSHSVWVEGIDNAVPVAVDSVVGDVVSVRLPTAPAVSGAALFYIASDILFPSRLLDISVQLPMDWNSWVADYLPLLTPDEAVDPTSLDTATKKSILSRILLTQLVFLGQFSPCRSEFRNVTVV